MSAASPEVFTLDPRLMNPYATADLETKAPAVHRALRAWFEAVNLIDDRALNTLIRARGPEAVAKGREAGEQALAACADAVPVLDNLAAALEEALSKSKQAALQNRLRGLVEAARINRVHLAENATRLVAAALESAADAPALREKAQRCIEDVTRRVEALAAQVGSARPYAELRPLLNAMMACWKEQGEAIKGLSQPDARQLLASCEERQKRASTALCRGILSAKASDRAAGVLPPSKVNALTRGRGAGSRFAAALANRDFKAAHGLLAPWLKNEWTSDKLRLAVEKDRADVANAASLPEPLPVESLRAERNSIGLEELRQGLRAALPGEITKACYAGWYLLEFLPDEEDRLLSNIDVLFSWGVVVVRDKGNELVGFIETGRA